MSASSAGAMRGITRRVEMHQVGRDLALQASIRFS